MAQKKAHEVDAWLARPEPSRQIVLIYGPDRGLVSERTRQFAQATGLPLGDPFSVIRLDAAELDQSPGRLEGEARTVPMFAGRRLIWVGNAGAQKALVEDLKRLMQSPAEDTLILIEAGDLKKGSPLRAAVESTGNAMALPCYADDMRSIDLLIDQELGRENLRISLDAREALKASLGGDRLASRGEITKLALYAIDKGQIDLDDVRAVIGDVGAVSADDVIDAVLGGKRRQFETAFSRYVAAGSQTFILLNAGMRQFQALQMMKGAMEKNGKSATAVVASARPPVFFSRRALVENVLKSWAPDMLERMLALLQRAILQSRQTPALATSITRQALLSVLIARSKR
ncbi:MAG TPA: DNA polymerase III subunit delta [Rhizobiaceae bacterium]|nr:DNA polymerase III subunit delta [Rhizobiaceae bacterium]